MAGTGSHRRSGPSMISTVNTIGAQEENDFWPSHKTYSPIISMDMYNVMFFHATLIKPMKESKTLNVGYTIYMIYLLLTSIACWTKGDKWRAERKKFVDQM